MRDENPFDYQFYDATWSKEKLEKLNKDLQDVVEAVNRKNCKYDPPSYHKPVEPQDCCWCGESCHPNIIRYRYIFSEEDDRLMLQGYVCQSCDWLVDEWRLAVDRDQT